VQHLTNRRRCLPVRFATDSASAPIEVFIPSALLFPINVTCATVEINAIAGADFVVSSLNP
jgi:hypothetical protein